MASKLTRLTILRRSSWSVLFTSNIFTGACPVDAGDLSEINRQADKPTDFESAVRFLKKELHPDSLTSLLESIPDQASAVSLFRWASSQQRFRHTVETYRAVLLTLALAGNSEKMDDILKEMVKLEPSDLDETLDSLIRTFVDNGMAKEALTVFRAACSAHRWPRISLCNDLLHTLTAERDNFEHVVFVYKEIVKGGLLPNIDTLNYLIEALLETGRIDSALEQFRRMPRKRCSPNSRTFELIIRGLCLEGLIEDYRKILVEMREMGIKPDAKFYNHVISLLCNVDRLEEALNLFQSMIASEIIPESQMADALVHHLIQKGQIVTALELFEEMSNKGFPLPGGVCSDIIVGYCKVGRFSKALQVLEMHPSSEVDPYNSLLQCYCDVGRFHDAVVVLQRLQKLNKCDGTSWNILIGALCLEGYIKLAYSVLARMIISSYMADEDTYNAILSGHCRRGEMRHAIDCFHQLCAKDWSIDSEFYNHLIVELCGTNNVSEASEIFHYMSSKGGTLVASTLNLLISCICLVGDFCQAVAIRLLASCSGISYGSDICSTIMQHFLAVGNSKPVLVLFAQMLVEGCILNARVYLLLLRGFLAENRIREVVILFELMISESKLHDPHIVYEIVSHLAEHGQLHSVIHALDKLLKEVGPLSSTSCNLVIAGLLKEGHRSDAYKYSELMLVRGWVPDEFTHGLSFGKIGGNKGNDDVSEEGTSLDAITSILAEGLKVT